MAPCSKNMVPPSFFKRGIKVLEQDSSAEVMESRSPLPLFACAYSLAGKAIVTWKNAVILLEMVAGTMKCTVCELHNCLTVVDGQQWVNWWIKGQVWKGPREESLAQVTWLATWPLTSQLTSLSLQGQLGQSSCPHFHLWLLCPSIREPSEVGFPPGLLATQDRGEKAQGHLFGSFLLLSTRGI
jgi:hypothetical protein